MPSNRKKAALPAKAPPQKSVKWGGIKITDSMLARARGGTAPKVNPFVLANHPPSVFPKGHSTIAMDDAINSSLSWAGAIIAAGFAEGLIFLGYPYLAELSQRAEYRRMAETLGTEMTRKWIKFQATGDEDKTDKIDELVKQMEHLEVRERFKTVAIQDAFFGRAHLYIDTGATDKLDELKKPIGNGRDKVSEAKIGKDSVVGIRNVEAVWCYPTQYNSNDPLKPDWYKPLTWFVMGKEMSATRLLTFVGREVSDLLKPAYSFGGLALSQMAKPYVDNWLRARQSVSDLIHSFSVFVLETDMSTSLQDGGADFFKRLDMFNQLRDNRGLMVTNKDSEGFQNVSAPLGSLDRLQAQAQEQMAAVCGIPLVKLLGITPSGLNASAEGEIRVFYDWIGAYQESLFRPNLTKVIDFIQLSLWGKVDQDITFIFEPLWSLDEKQMAEVRKIEVDTDVALINAAVISNAESRQRVVADPDSPYAGLDADEVPEAPDMTMEKFKLENELEPEVPGEGETGSPAQKKKAA